MLPCVTLVRRGGSRWKGARPRRSRRAPRRESPSVAARSRSSRVAILLVAKRATASGKVVALDARAVVDHAHAAHAAFRELDRDRLRARVEAVLHQLLQRRRRAVHHLAGGDLVHQELGEISDETHSGMLHWAPQAFPSGADRRKERNDPANPRGSRRPRTPRTRTCKRSNFACCSAFRVVGHLATLLVIFILGGILWQDLARPVALHVVRGDVARRGRAATCSTRRSSRRRRRRRSRSSGKAASSRERSSPACAGR